MLLVVSTLAWRLWLTWRPVPILHDPSNEIPRLARIGLVAMAASMVVLLPVLVGLGFRFLDDRLPESETLWRSSPRGLDALAYLVPNPNHAWFGRYTSRWFMPADPDAFPEFVGSFSLAALAVIAAGAWYRALPRFWVVFTAFFALLSMGPFLHVAGANTYVVGPWAFLRYVPVVGLARSPARFAIVVMLGLSVLCAFALDEIRWRQPKAWPRIAGVIAAALSLELLSVPRPLHSASVPDVYQYVAERAGDSGRLLELPSGVRDGTSSIGNFSAANEFLQTTHRRPLIGGYLSRLSEWRKREQTRVPMLRVLFALSEGQRPPAESLDKARATRDAFLRRSCIRFVVVDKARASQELRQFGVDALRLSPLYEDSTHALFAPLDPPPCEPRVTGRGRRTQSASPES